MKAEIVEKKQGQVYVSMMILVVTLCSSRCEQKCDFELSEEQKKELLVYSIPSKTVFINSSINDTVIINYLSSEDALIGMNNNGGTAPFCKKGVILRGVISKTKQLVGNSIEITSVLISPTVKRCQIGLGCFNYEINQQTTNPSYNKIMLGRYSFVNVYEQSLDTNSQYLNCVPYIYKLLFSLDSGIVALYQKNDTNAYVLL